MFEMLLSYVHCLFDSSKSLRFNVKSRFKTATGIQTEFIPDIFYDELVQDVIKYCEKKVSGLDSNFEKILKMRVQNFLALLNPDFYSFHMYNAFHDLEEPEYYEGLLKKYNIPVCDDIESKIKIAK